MGTVPDYQKYPYQEDKILSRDHQALADYLKNLVGFLGITYTELAQAINDIELGGGIASHHTTHEDGGSDEVSVAGLSGELVDAQIPKVHKTSHQNGGGDEISVTGLSGLLADEQNAGKIKAKPVDAPLAADDGKALTYDHANSKYKHVAPGGGEDIGEGHIVLFPWFYNSIGQGSWVWAINSKYFYNGYFWNDVAPANGDNFTMKACLAAGTYTLKLIADKHTNRGIVDIDIDGVEVASFDLYAAAQTYNVLFSQTGIVISTSGLKDIKFRIDGKNGSSGGYVAVLCALALYRTA